MPEPTPGSFGLSHVHGITGLFITLGQRLAGDSSPYGHAFLVLDNAQVLSGQPGGAVIEPLSVYLDRPDVVFSTLPTLTPEQVDHVVAIGRLYEHEPYAFGSYLALALLAAGVRPRFLRRLIARGSICSALVDRVYATAGIHLFTDGRPFGFVTPGALDRYRRALPADPPFDSTLDRLRAQLDHHS